MSYHVVRWILARSPVAVVSERFVLVVLGEHAGHDGWDARPAVETIASETGLSKRQVQRALGALQQAGAIEQTGIHGTGVRIWRVVMERDDFDAASWSAENDAYTETARQRTPENGDAFYRKPRSDTASPPATSGRRGGDVASSESPEPSKYDQLEIDPGDSDGRGDVTSPPGRHSVAPRLATAWQRAKTSLVDDARSGPAAAIYVEPLTLVSGDEQHVVLETLPAAAERTRDDWTGPISDALYEATGQRPTVHIVSGPEPEPMSFELSLPSPTTSGATRTLRADEESAPASTGRPDAGAGKSLDAPPEEEIA